MKSVSALYETLIERDLDAIPRAIGEFRRSHTSDDLFLAVARFAVLAYAPSQHAKHALLCCLSAHELREDFGERFDDLLTECAIYAAESRQPWSEPPILDPPAIDPAHRGDIDELRAAVAAGDRLRAERWLAKNHTEADFVRDYFAVAADDFEDLGHKMIIATAAWKLAQILGQQGRFATLRVGIWELASYRARRYDEGGVALDPRTLLDRLMRTFVAEGGSIIAAHAIFLFDAAIEAAEIADSAEIAVRVRDYLAANTSDAEAPALEFTPDPLRPPLYRLARDYGECLKMFAVAKRLRARYPDAQIDRITAAAYHNLEHAPSFEEWSFA